MEIQNLGFVASLLFVLIPTLFLIALYVSNDGSKDRA
ncbi:MAG: photosystem II reaction center protein PsbM [Leptolyngbyaceae cyanobacterium MO_188.B28]|nr:photosystem II reaction center protein PsbM [Leptolyngbyaceae cyanobacterium MO_188.B28]